MRLRPIAIVSLLALAGCAQQVDDVSDLRDDACPPVSQHQVAAYVISDEAVTDIRMYGDAAFRPALAVQDVGCAAPEPVTHLHQAADGGWSAHTTQDMLRELRVYFQDRVEQYALEVELARQHYIMSALAAGAE